MVRIGVALVHSLRKTNTSFALRVCAHNDILPNVLGTVIHLTSKMGQATEILRAVNLGTFWGTYARRQTQPGGVRRKRFRCFSQETRADRTGRNHTQKTGENSQTGGCRFESCRACEAKSLRLGLFTFALRACRPRSHSTVADFVALRR